MKKILLSCVTCLLALGLVTACDTEEDEKASGGDDSTTEESDTTTDDTTEAVTLTNYTVSFSFVDEAGAAATLGDGYTLYLSGSWDGWAGWVECPYDEVSGYYTGTFASIVSGTYEYKGVSCVTGDPSWAGEEVVTNNGGNATLTVTESNSGQVITVTLVEAIYLSNYTLRFTFTGVTIPDYAVLYITGDFNGWALDALTEGDTASTGDEGDPADGLATLEEDPKTGTEAIYTYTLESISVGEHKYKVIACYTGEEASWDDCVEVVIDEWGSDATLEVSEASGDDYTHEISYEIPSTIDFTTLMPEALTNVTLSFTFYATDGVTQLTIPEGYQISVAGSFDVSENDWVLDANHVLTAAVDEDEETPTGAYTYTLNSITSSTYQFQFLYDKVGEQSWTHPLMSNDLSLKIGKGTSNSTIEYDIVTRYDSFEGIIHEKVEGVNSDFYIVLLDGSETEITADSFSSTTITLATGGSYFSNASSTTSLTFGTTSTSETTYLASPKGTMTSWSSDWFTFYVGSWDPQIACGTLEVPATEDSTCAVYVAYANLNILLTTAGSSTSENCWGGYWVTGVTSFDTFVATL